jgi:protein TonB
MDPMNEPLNEIIFEKRNKTYGAYVLRKEYPESLRIALFIAHAFLGLVLLGAALMRTDKIVLPDLPELPGAVPFDYPVHPRIPDPPKPKVTPPTSTTSSIPMVTNDSLEIVDTPKPPAEGPVSSTMGTDTTSTAPPEVGGGLSGPPIEPEKPEVPTLAPDEHPNMPGGLPEFLRRNLNYPELAEQRKTQGTVYISFVVEKDGNVSNIEVLKGVGDGLEEEAVRVVKKMKWNPGKAKGHPVRVRFTLPIKFVMR